MTKSLDLTAFRFENDSPAAAHHPKQLSFGEAVAHVAVAGFVVGLVVGLPVFTFLRLMGWW